MRSAIAGHNVWQNRVKATIPTRRHINGNPAINRSRSLSDLQEKEMWSVLAFQMGQAVRRDRTAQVPLEGLSMQPCLNETQRAMKALLDAVEDHAQQKSAEVTDSRSETRRPLHVESTLCLFPPDDEMQIIENVFARNITFLGLSLMGFFPDWVEPGCAVEAIVKPINHTPTYLAGIVVFRRSVSADCCEIGVSVKAAGCTAILMQDVGAALEMYDWFAEAMEAKRSV
jgi:hypothetical protein